VTVKMTKEEALARLKKTNEDYQKVMKLAREQNRLDLFEASQMDYEATWYGVNALMHEIEAEKKASVSQDGGR
jgi:hypothetical protein